MNESPDKPAASQPKAPEITEAAALAELNELSSRLSRIGELEEGLQEILSAVIELLGAAKGNIQLFDRERWSSPRTGV